VLLLPLLLLLLLLLLQLRRVAVIANDREGGASFYR